MTLSRSSILLAATFATALCSAAACEPEVGSPCDADTAYVNSHVSQTTGSNDLVLDVAFDNCSQALCASVEGSRPFCTKACEGDLDCSEAAGFTCQQIVQFGPLACRDYTPEHDCTQSDGTPSALPLKYCSASPDVIVARDKQFGRSK